MQTSVFNFNKLTRIFLSSIILSGSIWLMACDVLGPKVISDEIWITDETGRSIGGDTRDWCKNGVSNNRIVTTIIGESDFSSTVNLDSLKITKDSNKVNVSWITNSESSCRRFNLERRHAGSTYWDTLKKVSCNGTIGVTRYKLIDTLYSFGTYLYRLRQVDSAFTSILYIIPDTIKYSYGVTPISVTSASGFSFGAAYPNPTINRRTTVNFSVPVSGLVRVYLDNGEDIVNRQLSAGIYSVQIDGAAFGFVNEVRTIYMEANGFSCYGDIQFNE